MNGRVLTSYLARLFRQDCDFLLPRLADNRFHVAGAQHDPTIPSSPLLASPASSPCLVANKGIGLLATESPSCLTLQLCQTNHMWEGNRRS